MLKTTILFAWFHQSLEEASFNAETLCKLYEIDPKHEEPGIKKLKIILISSICESFMSDFLIRLKSDHPELPSLTLDENSLKEAKGRHNWRFVDMINFFNKNAILYRTNHEFYTDLDEVRTARNRVHLLGAEQVHEQGRDFAFFSSYDISKAEKVLESMLFVFNKKYSRESMSTKSTINLPWEPIHKKHWEKASID